MNHNKNPCFFVLAKIPPKMEQELNERTGFTKEDDRLPKWMTEEAIPEIGAVTM